MTDVGMSEEPASCHLLSLLPSSLLADNWGILRLELPNVEGGITPSTSNCHACRKLAPNEITFVGEKNSPL